MKGFQISVITVCKNTQASIAPTIESVLSQKGVHLQYVVVDGASTDGTLRIINLYKDRIDAILSEPDHGIYDAMNKGLALATGELIFFLNAGDTFFDERVCSNASSAFAARGADILYGDVKVMKSSTREARHLCYADWDLARFIGRTICHQGVFASRKAFEICGPFDPCISVCADYAWLLIAFRRHRLKSEYLPHVIANYDGSGISSNPDPAVQSRIQGEARRAKRKEFTFLEWVVSQFCRVLRIRTWPLAWPWIRFLMRWELNAATHNSTAGAKKL